MILCLSVSVEPKTAYLALIFAWLECVCSSLMKQPSIIGRQVTQQSLRTSARALLSPTTQTIRAHVKGSSRALQLLG